MKKRSNNFWRDNKRATPLVLLFYYEHKKYINKNNIKVNRMEKDVNGLEGKYVFIKLKLGHVYSGRVLKHDDELIKIVDKFGSIVWINEEDIALLKEEVRG